MAPTGANQFSSRSHALLLFHVTGRDRARGTVNKITNSRLSLVDLAGSERAAASDNRG